MRPLSFPNHRRTVSEIPLWRLSMDISLADFFFAFISRMRSKHKFVSRRTDDANSRFDGGTKEEALCSDVFSVYRLLSRGKFRSKTLIIIKCEIFKAHNHTP